MNITSKDKYDVGYMRRWNEYDKITNPFGLFVLGVIFVGLILALISLSAITPPDFTSYQKANGEEIVVQANGDYILYENSVFLPEEERNIDNETNKALSILGVTVVLGGLLSILGYYFVYVPIKCKDAGWELVEKWSDEK